MLLGHPVKKIFISLFSFSLPLRSPNCYAIGIIWLPGYMKRNCILHPPEINFCWGKHTSVVKESIRFPPASHLCSMF